MATSSPAQQIADETRALQNKVSSLQDDVRLAKVRDAVEDLQTKINNQTQRIAAARGRGYVFENDLEAKAQSYMESWALLYPNLQMQINQQSTILMSSMRPIEMQMPQLAAAAANPFTARSILNTLQASVSQLESKVSAAESTIKGMYDQFERQVAEFTRHIDQVEYMLTQLAEATFGLLPTEGGIAAVKAIWCKSGKEQKGDPEGVLYLTDQRLIFEQKEEIVTKKVLFVATEKQMVQGLQLEAPVALVDNLLTSKAGLLKNEDHIEVHFQPGAPVQTAHFHIWQENTAWQALINRAKAKDYDKTRAVGIDQAEVARVKAAPTKCPACGGAITQVVLRGQDTIKCEFCGNIIRL